MPAFVHASLLWGLLIVAIPLLIHLINLLRHRRVEWGAMEFLLESQKKNRRWVLLRQLMLLAARMAAVAAVVFILAQPLLDSRWSALLGGSRTHHIVLLDDSFSMTDRRADSDAFTRAKQSITQLGNELVSRGVPQTFTLLRFSRGAQVDAGGRADLLEEPVGGNFLTRLEETLEGLHASHTDAGPREALAALEKLLESEAPENRVIYLVSDFRTSQWEEPEELKSRLAKWTEAGVQLHFIACVNAQRPNLAITSLEPQPGTRAAGVPLFMNVSVQNFGSDPARNVSVLLEENGSARPAVVIDEIPPGAVETRRFLVQFPTAGQHTVTASLESDTVDADNERYQVVDLPLSEPVLIVDGSPDALNARFLATALAPGGTIRTGIEPRIETMRFLYEQDLSPYRSIYLTNLGVLDSPAVEALERYVRQGGGVGIFLGDETEAALVNERLYRDGQGLFPLPLAAPTDLLVDRLERGADLQVSDHPMFRVFAGERNSFLQTVTIERYFAASPDWVPGDEQSVRIIARLRNGSPLAVERKLGDGRVVAMLTTAAPLWNNWGRNPSYVVAMLELQSYLASSGRQDTPLTVGTLLSLQLDPVEYQPRVRFTMPSRAAGMTTVTSDAVLRNSRLEVALADTDFGGIYEAELTRTDGQVEQRRYALNVVADEGNLARVDGEGLAAAIDGVPFEYHLADTLRFSTRELAGFNVSEALLYALVLLLLGEQWLAYTASYHAQRTKGARR